MRKTKDQRDLQAVLVLAKEASDAAYSLFSRRLDTQRNIESFLRLKLAVTNLRLAVTALQEAVDLAVDTKSTSVTTVMDEIMIRSGRARLVTEQANAPEESNQQPGVVLPFPKKP